MGVLGDKLDLAMENGKFRMNKVIFCFSIDLLQFFFYRSLFMNISKYVEQQ